MSHGPQDATSNGRNGNGANLGFEEKLWQAADKLRRQVDAAEYKHIVLGLIFRDYGLKADVSALLSPGNSAIHFRYTAAALA